MKVHRLTRLLALLLGLPAALPALAEEAEEMTDELPDWMEAELEDARAWQLQVEGRSSYGSNIPSPEEVVRGGAAAPPPPSDAVAAEALPPPEDVTFEDFYEALKPYGKWMHTPEYGLVFVPGARIQRDGWRPYLYGQWVWTVHGWTWVSDEPFGWATYHYGRWGYRVGIGWFWVPGYVWGPAWVVWRHGPDVIGWAPLYPGYVRVTASYPVHVDHWIFVGHRHFCGHPIHFHWYRHHHHHFHRTQWVKHWRHKGRVYVGPPRSWIARHGHVHEVRIVHVHRPAPSRLVGGDRDRELRIYRPSAVRPARPADPARLRASRPTVGSGLLRGAPAMREPARVDRRVTAPARPSPKIPGKSSPSVREPFRGEPPRSVAPSRKEPRGDGPTRRVVAEPPQTPKSTPRSIPERKAVPPREPKAPPRLERNASTSRPSSSLSAPRRATSVERKLTPTRPSSFSVKAPATNAPASRLFSSTTKGARPSSAPKHAPRVKAPAVRAPSAKSAARVSSARSEGRGRR